MFTHVVFFWLKPEADSQAAEAIISSCNELLAKIPSVASLEAGKAAGTPRNVVDNSYAAALCVRFEGRAEHDEYQAHALHQEFIARHQEVWDRVQVYDFVT